MGSRGPSKTPTAVLAQRGSWRAAQRAHEPRPVEGPIHPPVEFSAEEWVLWDRLVELLTGMQVLTSADVFALARYVKMFIRWQLAQYKLEHRGEVMVLYDDGPEIDPADTAPLAELELPDKLHDLLTDAGCRYVFEVGKAIEEDLLERINGIGKKTAATIVDLHSRWRQANPPRRQVKYEQQRPEVAIVSKLNTELRAIEDRFGLSPSARANIHLTDAQVGKLAADRQSKVRSLIAGNATQGRSN